MNVKKHIYAQWILLSTVVIFIGINLNQNRTSVVTLDSSVIVNEYLEKMTKINKKNVDMLKKTDEFSSCLTRTVEKYSEKYHYLILPKKAAISGEVDVTDSIRKLMEKRCE